MNKFTKSEAQLIIDALAFACASSKDMDTLFTSMDIIAKLPNFVNEGDEDDDETSSDDEDKIN